MSSSLLNNKYFSKLEVNRLQANEIKSENILSNESHESHKSHESYLYSAILNNVEFKQVFDSESNAELIINLVDQTQEVIQFTDRPFIQSSKITIEDFVELFLIKEPESFAEVPPNVVLSFNNVQKSYKMSLASELNKQVIFNLKLLTGEEHTQENFTGTINIFVDNCCGYA